MPKIRYDSVSSEFGPGMLITLSGDEMARAVDLYLVAQQVIVRGPRTVRYDGKLFQDGACEVYVDPSGFITCHNTGKGYDGRGEDGYCCHVMAMKKQKQQSDPSWKHCPHCGRPVKKHQ